MESDSRPDVGYEGRDPLVVEAPASDELGAETPGEPLDVDEQLDWINHA